MKLICLTAALINLTSEPFNSHDLRILRDSQKVCNEQSLCVRSFQKREPRFYRVLCGEKTEFDKKALLEAEKDAIIEELNITVKETDPDKKLEIIKKKLKTIGMD